MSSAEVLLQVSGLAGLGLGILLATAVDHRTSFAVYLAATAIVIAVHSTATRRGRTTPRRPG